MSSQPRPAHHAAEYHNSSSNRSISNRPLHSTMSGSSSSSAVAEAHLPPVPVVVRECHILPCKINHSGKCDTDYVYFRPQRIIIEDVLADNAATKEGDGKEKKRKRSGQEGQPDPEDNGSTPAATVVSTTTTDDDDGSSSAPAVLLSQSSTSSSDADADGDAPTAISKAKTTYRAVQFRGRGLISAVDDGDCLRSKNLRGCVLEIRKKPGNNNKETEGCGDVKVAAEFDRLVEWHHELSGTLEGFKKKNTGSQLVRRVRDWVDVASALHAPLPLEEQETATTQ